MIWHFLVDITSQTAFCRDCGTKCGTFDTPARTTFFCKNVWCKNMKILYHDQQKHIWTIGEAKDELVRLANGFFAAAWGTGKQP